MGVVKSYLNAGENSPSTFALLVDNINKMSESEQKALWIELNREKLSVLAKEIDSSVTTHNYNTDEIDALINDARKKGSGKKKG